MDVDAVVRPLDGWRAGGRAEEPRKAGGQREKVSPNDLRISFHTYGKMFNENRILQLPDGGFLFLLDWRTLPRRPERKDRKTN